MKDEKRWCLNCSLEEGHAHECPPEFACRECQVPFRPAFFAPELAQRLAENGLCFSCQRWTDALAWAQSPNSVRIEGRHYWIGPEEVSEREPRGFLGQRFLIRRFPESTGAALAGLLVETTNLWSQGTIPEHFRARLPDNARWEQHQW